MAQRIKFLGTGQEDNKGQICWDGLFSDHTLCGDTLDGDTMTAGGYEPTKEKVNCEHCIRIVTYSKKIKRSEWVGN